MFRNWTDHGRFSCRTSIFCFPKRQKLDAVVYKSLEKHCPIAVILSYIQVPKLQQLLLRILFVSDLVTSKWKLIRITYIFHMCDMYIYIYIYIYITCSTKHLCLCSLIRRFPSHKSSSKSSGRGWRRWGSTMTLETSEITMKSPNNYELPGSGR